MIQVAIVYDYYNVAKNATWWMKEELGVGDVHAMSLMLKQPLPESRFLKGPHDATLADEITTVA